MVEEVVVGEGSPTSRNGKPLHGGIIVKTTIQVLCTLSQRAVDAIQNQGPRTTWIHDISRLQTIH